jgi:uncharacterized protein with LGFP repeats
LLRRLTLVRQDGLPTQEPIPGPPGRRSRRRWLALAGAALLSLAGASLYVSYTRTGNERDSTQSSSEERVSPIREKWAAVGREASPLGNVVGDEVSTFDGVGRWQQFKGGIISWHPETGAHIVWGKIGERWLEIGREEFGYPITDELTTSDQRGRASDFRALHVPHKPVASIYWLPDTGAHEIFGAIRDKWTELGAERSALGYPSSPEQPHADGRVQRFQRGSLFWTARSGVIIQ